MMTSRTFVPARGAILLLTLVISAAIMAATTAFFGYYAAAVTAERVAFASAQARTIAEAGVDQAIYSLNQNSGYSGESNTALGAGSFSVAVTTIDSVTKRLTVTSYVPNATAPLAKKTVSVTANINASVVSFRYGVQVGDSGVTMNNGSTVNGNIISNGSIIGSGTITGDATVTMNASSTPDQQSTVQNSSFAVGDTSAHAYVAQMFKPSTSGSLAAIKLYMSKVGNPGDLSVWITTDRGGVPTSSILTTGTLPSSLLTSAYGFADVSLSGTPNLTKGTEYWIVVGAANINSGNYVQWGLDTAGGYTSGWPAYASKWSSRSWKTFSGDLGFQMYLGGTGTSISGVTVQGNAWAYNLSNCTVGGTATYQTISGCSVTGTQYPGTAPATPSTFPISDAQIASWEATAAAGGTIAGPYSVSGTLVTGPKKITGDLTVTNGATLMLSGPVWVTGNITISNNGALGVSSNTGTSGAVLIADATGNTSTSGKVTLSNNITVSGNGNTGSMPMVISTNTGNKAIYLSNNAASIILYAPYGGVEVSNGASANQVTAKRLELENNSSVNYQAGLQSASFSNGPGGSWAVVPGTYAVTN